MANILCILIYSLEPVLGPTGQTKREDFLAPTISFHTDQWSLFKKWSVVTFQKVITFQNAQPTVKWKSSFSLDLSKLNLHPLKESFSKCAVSDTYM